MGANACRVALVKHFHPDFHSYDHRDYCGAARSKFRSRKDAKSPSSKAGDSLDVEVSFKVRDTPRKLVALGQAIVSPPFYTQLHDLPPK